jgi:cytochrome c biogenesis protein
MGRAVRGLRTLWRALGSTRLAAILLAAVLLTVLLASLFPQAPSSSASLQAWLAAVTLRYGHSSGWLQSLGLFEATRSPWFLALLACLVVNTLICTVQRLPRLWRSLGQIPLVSHPERFYHGFSHREEWPVASLEEGLAGARSILTRHRYRPRLERDEGSACAHVYAERGRLTQSATVLSHLAAALLIVAVVARPALGWQDTDVLLSTGQAYRVGHGTSLTFSAGSLEIETYPDGEPRAYRVPVSVQAGTLPAVTELVRNNHPLTFRGVAFHLQGYGPGAHLAAPGESVDLAFAGSQAQEAAFAGGTLTLRVGYQPEDRSLFVEAFSADGALLGSGRVDDGQQVEVEGVPITFSLSGYTVWQVSHDPTFGLAVGAASVLLAATLSTLWLPYRRLWLRITGSQAQMVGTGDLAGDFELLAHEMADACEPDQEQTNDRRASAPPAGANAGGEPETDA